MADKINELKRQILEKNLLLEEIRLHDNSEKEQIRQIKRDLDNLLYLYYKSLRCKCSNYLSLWCSAL